MNAFITLLQKEWLEAWRDKKLIWLPIVFSILAVSQPISLYYMPEILDKAGNLPEGAVINIPTPSGEEVLSSTLSQFGIIGTAIIVLSMMGIISHERNSGVLSMVMARPVQPLQYIGSKWVAHAVILMLSFGLGYGLAYYYTIVLFHDVSFSRFLLSFAVYAVWILFTMTVTLCVGTVLRKTGGIAGASLLLAAGLSLIGTLFPKLTTWSPVNAHAEATHFLLTGSGGDAFFSMVIMSSLLIVLFFFIATFCFKHFESY